VKFERFADLLDPSVVHHQDAVCKRHRFDLNHPTLPHNGETIRFQEKPTMTTDSVVGRKMIVR
jgi:hypothetical protein